MLPESSQESEFSSQNVVAGLFIWSAAARRRFRLVVARGADPGAVRLVDPPAHRAGLQREKSPSVSIRVHPWLKRAENPKKSGLEAENRDYGPETARKWRFQAVFHPFSPARPVAARFR